ncbi:MAG: BufA2 family periplasmic bufferin-type metallophore [Methyloligellaceae bacterium]
MKLSKTSGTAIAAAAAALILSGASVGVTSAQAGDGKKVHCYGVNSCKGTSACKTASSACKGQNGCKGKGFLSLTAEECKAKGGSTEEKKK